MYLGVDLTRHSAKDAEPLRVYRGDRQTTGSDDMAATNFMVSGFINSYAHETERWKIDHDEANACVEFEELLALGNSAFDAISRWDTIWHQQVNEGKHRFDAAYERDILNLYADWLAPSEYMLEVIARHEQKGYVVVGADVFRRYCEDASGLATDDVDFFGEELLPHQDKALDDNRRGMILKFEEMGD
jgi:hypothetical protein